MSAQLVYHYKIKLQYCMIYLYTKHSPCTNGVVIGDLFSSVLLNEMCSVLLHFLELMNVTPAHLCNMLTPSLFPIIHCLLEL